jgi:S-phase kinase-associated protein 1
MAATTPAQQQITLTSSDNESFKVDLVVAEKSILIKNMVEDIGEDDTVVPLPNVNANVLKKVLEWCEHHRNDPSPEKEDDSANNALAKYVESCRYMR